MTLFENETPQDRNKMELFEQDGAALENLYEVEYKDYKRDENGHWVYMGGSDEESEESESDGYDEESEEEEDDGEDAKQQQGGGVQVNKEQSDGGLKDMEIVEEGAEERVATEPSVDLGMGAGLGVAPVADRQVAADGQVPADNQGPAAGVVQVKKELSSQSDRMVDVDVERVLNGQDEDVQVGHGDMSFKEVAERE